MQACWIKATWFTVVALSTNTDTELNDASLDVCKNPITVMKCVYLYSIVRVQLLLTLFRVICCSKDISKCVNCEL